MWILKHFTVAVFLSLICGKLFHHQTLKHINATLFMFFFMLMFHQWPCMSFYPQKKSQWSKNQQLKIDMAIPEIIRKWNNNTLKCYIICNFPYAVILLPLMYIVLCPAIIIRKQKSTVKDYNKNRIIIKIQI